MQKKLLIRADLCYTMPMTENIIEYMEAVNSGTVKADEESIAWANRIQRENAEARKRITSGKIEIVEPRRPSKNKSK